MKGSAFEVSTINKAVAYIEVDKWVGWMFFQVLEKKPLISQTLLLSKACVEISIVMDNNIGPAHLPAKSVDGRKNILVDSVLPPKARMSREYSDMIYNRCRATGWSNTFDF